MSVAETVRPETQSASLVDLSDAAHAALRGGVRDYVINSYDVHVAEKTGKVLNWAGGIGAVAVTADFVGTYAIAGNAFSPDEDRQEVAGTLHDAIDSAAEPLGSHYQDEIVTCGGWSESGRCTTSNIHTVSDPAGVAEFLSDSYERSGLSEDQISALQSALSPALEGLAGEVRTPRTDADLIELSRQAAESYASTIADAEPPTINVLSPGVAGLSLALVALGVALPRVIRGRMHRQKQEATDVRYKLNSTIGQIADHGTEVSGYPINSTFPREVLEQIRLALLEAPLDGGGKKRTEILGQAVGHARRRSTGRMA